MLNKSKIFLLAKLLLGAGLIAILLASVDITLLLDRARDINLSYLLLMCVLPHVAMLLATVKWQVLLVSLLIHCRLWRLFGLYFIGTFFSNFLPTMIGGDAVRSYTLALETGRAESVLAATFMERFVGLTALVSLLPLVLIQEPIRNAVPMADILLISVMMAYALLLILVFSPIFDLFSHYSFKNKLVARIWGFIIKTHDSVRVFRKHKLQLFFSYVISMGFYLLTIATPWAAAKSIGVDMDFVYLASIVPVVMLATIIPISFNGLGIAEAGYVLLFQLVGVPLEDAIFIALIMRVRLVLTGLLGGLVFLKYRPNRKSGLSLAEITEHTKLDDAAAERY